ncbi:diketogulonate reductase-like aldo/keto reductase [Tumebacillus sp. BK434]|uniref:aldo/keto reductase n=1 Tax=Tumebacillus sp. BK434 TaxID=2512169 RepID=UPI0010504407|nr:aldo/keto reductase [Tumebacillus sp. BK434]TCP57913.1 diketogulonate reductase-like aldo/keto reductase [Tumebacillus sp. BK434]
MHTQVTPTPVNAADAAQFAPDKSRTATARTGSPSGALSASYILQMQKAVGNRAAMQLLRARMQPQSTRQRKAAPRLSGSPLQMAWEPAENKKLKWDDVSDGLQWFFDPVTELMYFAILDISPPYMETLAPYENMPRPYSEWTEIWRKQDWTDDLPPQEELEPRPVFGTDFPKDRDPSVEDLEVMIDKPAAEKLNILKNALRSGYRVFDTAELYGNAADLIFQAARELEIPFDEIEIIYKVEPENPDTKGSNRSKHESLGFRLTDMGKRLRHHMETIPESAHKVIMLHEMPDNPDHIFDYLQALYAEMVSGTLGAVTGLGVSNVSLKQLQAIHDFTVEKNMMRLRYVQNRFSPYNLNLEIVNFCQSNDITFMGYGIQGGAGLGACKQGYAVPQKQLQVLQDQRFLALAEEFGIDPSQLLLAWSKTLGVSVVMYSGGHAEENYEALSIQLSAGQIRQINALFAYDQDTTRSAFSGVEQVQALYQAALDPTVWYILDGLMANPDIRALIGAVVTKICTSEDADQVEQELENFVQKLVRFATHMQVLKKSRLVRDWRSGMQDAFEGLIGQVEEVTDLAKGIYNWSQSDHLEIGGALHALEELNQHVPQQEEADEGAEQAPALDPGTRLTITKATGTLMNMDSLLIDAEYSTLAAGDTEYILYYEKQALIAKITNQFGDGRLEVEILREME